VGTEVPRVTDQGVDLRYDRGVIPAHDESALGGLAQPGPWKKQYTPRSDASHMTAGMMPRALMAHTPDSR